MFPQFPETFKDARTKYEERSVTIAFSNKGNNIGTSYLGSGSESV